MAKYQSLALLGIFFHALFAAAAVNPELSPELSNDVAFDRMAYQLELIRNQMELTVLNRAGAPRDIRRQAGDIAGMHIFERIPLAAKEPRDSGLAEMRQDLPGMDVKFVSGWRSAPRRVSRAVGFDENYRIPEDQVVDRRSVEIASRFERTLPADPAGWLKAQLRHAHRLMTPEGACASRGLTLRCRVLVYRFRELEYPKFLTPDLGKYPVPAQAPRTESQRASLARIKKYRQDIVRLWPEVEPHLDNIRAFALNDLRIGFFLKHAR